MSMLFAVGWETFVKILSLPSPFLSTFPCSPPCPPSPCPPTHPPTHSHPPPPLLVITLTLCVGLAQATILLAIFLSIKTWDVVISLVPCRLWKENKDHRIIRKISCTLEKMVDDFTSSALKVFRLGEKFHLEYQLRWINKQNESFCRDSSTAELQRLPVFIHGFQQLHVIPPWFWLALTSLLWFYDA